MSWFTPHTVTVRPITQEQDAMTLDATNPERGTERTVAGDFQMLSAKQSATAYGLEPGMRAEFYVNNPAEAQYFQGGYEVVFGGIVYAVVGDTDQKVAGDSLDHGVVMLERIREDS